MHGCRGGKYLRVKFRSLSGKTYFNNVYIKPIPASRIFNVKKCLMAGLVAIGSFPGNGGGRGGHRTFLACIFGIPDVAQPTWRTQHVFPILIQLRYTAHRSQMLPNNLLSRIT